MTSCGLEVLGQAKHERKAKGEKVVAKEAKVGKVEKAVEAGSWL